MDIYNSLRYLINEKKCYSFVRENNKVKVLEYDIENYDEEDDFSPQGKVVSSFHYSDIFENFLCLGIEDGFSLINRINDDLDYFGPSPLY